MRDRRFDHLYERQKQPVKAYVLERFADLLADELAAFPPPTLDWASDELRARWADGAAERPREDVLRLALEIARLDLARAFEEIEPRLEREAHRLRTPTERSALQLLVSVLTERCLALKEHAEGARIARSDLVAMLDLVERRLFRVTAG